MKFGAICDGDRRQCGIRHTPALPAAILEREHTSDILPDAGHTASPAPPFTLPTIADDQASLTDHEGRHNVLLFFNEGMG